MGTSSEYNGCTASGDRGLSFGLSLPLLPYFVYVRSEGSGETVGMFRLSEPLLLADAIRIKVLCNGPYNCHIQ